MTTTRHKLLAYTAALFPLFCIAIGKGYNYTSGLILFFSIIALIPIRKEKITPEAKLYILALCFYFFSFAITTIYTQNSISDIDRPSRAILAIPIFIALLRYPPTFKMLVIGVISASYTIWLISLYFAIFHPHTRAFDAAVGGWWLKGYMQIQTGGMASTLSISSLLLAIFMYKQKQHLFMFISVLAALLALYASLLSGSRGSWLFLPIAITYLFIVNQKKITKRNSFLFLVAIAVLCLIAAQSSMVQKRVNKGIENIELYISGENKTTSLGIRLELWKSAIYTFTEHPILGVGTKDRSASRRAHGKQGLIDKKVSRKVYHAHNQYLENLSMYGIVGFIGLMGILVYPLYLFEKIRRKRQNQEVIILCQMGSLSIIMMIGYCMTQAFFNHNSGITYYVVFTSILLATVLCDDAIANNKLEVEP